MKAPSKNRSGFKKTEVGWIPRDWRCTPAGSIFEIQLGKMLSKQARNGANPQPYLANYNVRWGGFDLRKIQQMDFYEKEVEKFQLQQGDLLVCEGGEVGRCAVWEDQIKPCYFQKALHRVRPARLDVDVYYAMYFLHYAAASSIMAAFIGQSSISHFTREQFMKFPIALPPLDEQIRIREILGVWDSAIGRTRDLIAALHKRKQAVLRYLLKGEKRLPGFSSSWNVCALGDLFKERTETNKGHLPLLALTANKGIVPAAEIDRKDSSSVDKSMYKRIAPGDICYNTMRMWQGVCAVSEREGIVSPAYTICAPKKDVDPAFMGYLFKLPSVVHLFYRYSQGLVSDTLNLKFRHFAQIKIKIPAIREQNGIAQAISAFDAQIRLHERKAAALEKQKRGLMQKLLTGKVRVKT